MATTAYLTRTISTDSYGIYALAITAGTVGNVLLFQWMRIRVLLSIGSDSYLQTKRDATTYYLAGTIALLILFIFVSSIFGTVFNVISLSVVSLLSIGWFDLVSELSRSQTRVIKYLLLFCAKGIGTLGFSYVAVKSGCSSAGGAIAAYSLGCLIPVILSTRYIFSDGLGTLASTKRELRSGWILAASYGVASLGSMVDRPLLNLLGGAAATGIYIAAAEIPRLGISLAMQSVNLAGFPVIAKLHNEGRHLALKEQLGKNGAVIAIIGSCATVTFSLFAKEICGLLLGEAFRESASSLIPMLSLGAYFVSLRTFYFDQSFLLARRFGIICLLNIGLVVLAAALSFLLVPSFGASGAAIVFNINAISGIVASHFLAQKDLRFPVPKGIFVASAIAVTISLLGFSASANIFFRITIAIASLAVLIHSLPIQLPKLISKPKV